MKRIIAAAMAACMLLGGCSVIRESDKPGAFVSTSVLDMSVSEMTGRVLTSAVYFLNPSDTLTAEPRKLVIATDANPAATAVQALLKGPSESSGLKGVAPAGMTLEFIEFSRDVANVYLRYDGEPMQPRDLFILKLAIANTVTDILGAAYICVFINDVQTGFSGDTFSGVPSAPLKKQTGSVEEAWQQAQGKYAAAQSIITVGVPETQATPEVSEFPEAPATPETSATPKASATPGASVSPETTASAQPTEPASVDLQAVIYYMSADESYLLPEVHTVTFSQGQCVQALFSELKKTPNKASIMKSPLSEDVELTDAFISDADGIRTLTLRLSQRPDLNAGKAALSYAAIIYTLTGFIPNVNAVDIDVAGNNVASIEGVRGLGNGIQRSDFIGYIGSSAPLYFADKNSDLLLELSRSMEQGKTWSARARVLELLKGPLEGEGDNILPVMITGMTESDIISVDVYSDTAYVNLSQHFKDVCAGVSAKTEMMLIYAIVNTLTAMDGVSKVQFLIEGRQTQSLAGTLCLADPFLRNYGVIKKAG